MAKQFLDKTGLTTLWNKIKATFATKTSLSATDNQVNTLVNTTRELTNRTTNLDNNKLGKNETADSCKSAIDIVNGERLEFAYQRELSDLAWFATWQRNENNKRIPELCTISKDNVKRVLGINDLVTKANNAISTANSASSTASNADAKAQQAINQINSVNQDKITKDDLVFSLSGSTLTITKRY